MAVCVCIHVYSVVVLHVGTGLVLTSDTPTIKAIKAIKLLVMSRVASYVYTTCVRGCPAKHYS